jgi:hypothetical protein
MGWWLDLLTTYTHHSELQVVTVPLLNSTIHRSPQHPLCVFPACCVFNSFSIVTAYNSGDSSASRTHVVTVQWISCNSTLADCQINYSTISSHPSFQNSTQLPTLNWTLSPTSFHFTSLHFTSLNWTATQPSPSPSYFMTGGLPPISSSSRQAFWDSRPEIFFSTDPLQS